MTIPISVKSILIAWTRAATSVAGGVAGLIACVGAIAGIVGLDDDPKAATWQGEVIEKILRHCGLWIPASPRTPPARDLRVYDPDGNWESDPASPTPRELTFVDEDTFWATF